VACLAGLSKMPWRVFVLASLSGSLPLGFVFAAIGALGVEQPGWALALSAGMPLLLYGIAAAMFRK
jgi:uncharacterized membrane protein YdjX (TVP38/TMEM64 family)